MAFPRDEVSKLLAECHRRCCICHRFCGVKMETDHINPKAKDDGGSDSIENAIPVCFECHAEIHSYNPKHPRGRKFTPEELRHHKKQWLNVCHTRPDVFVNAARDAGVGPLQALIDELEFNLRVSDRPIDDEPGCAFQDEQFRRAIREGAISVLDEELKRAIIEAYVLMGRANQVNSSVLNTPRGSNLWDPSAARKAAINCAPKISGAKQKLLQFLSSAEDS